MTVTNFEHITHELSEDELEIIPLVKLFFELYNKENPIKSPAFVEMINRNLLHNGYTIQINEVRLRKFVNYIRKNSLLPLIATSKGYFVSYDPEVIKSQIRSLRERASSILDCANGLQGFIPVEKNLTVQ